MTGKRYYGYPAWVDSPHAMSVHDELERSRKMVREQARHNRAVLRNWPPRKRKPVSSAAGDTSKHGRSMGLGGAVGWMLGILWIVYMLYGGSPG